MLANRNTSITTVLLMLTIITTTLLPGCSCNSGETDVVSTGDEVLTDEEIEQLDSACQDLNAIRESDDYKSQDVDSKKNTMMKALFEQAQKGNIIGETIRLDEKQDIISYRFSSGIKGFERFGEYDENTKGIVDPDHDIRLENKAAEGTSKADAIILNAITSSSVFTVPCERKYTKWNKKGITTLLDDSVTLDDLTNLQEYEFVYISMHGGYVTFGEYINFEYNFAEDATPYAVLEEQENVQTSRKYSKDFEEGSIGIHNGHYFFTPTFFSHHYPNGELSNSILFLGGCNQMNDHSEKQQGDWERELEKISVPSFVSYRNSVDAGYDFDMVDSFLYSLLDGKTTGEALKEAKKINGDNDWEWEKKNNYEIDDESAYPVLGCSSDAVLKWETADPSAAQAPTVTPSTEPAETPTPSPSPTPTPEPTATPTPRPDSKLAISKNNFPDKEFRRFLKNEVDKNKDGSLSKKEISKVKKMDFYDESGQPDGGGNGPYVYDIADLTGIERFANLESINIPFNNYLKHLDMTKNPKLKKVRFFDILPVKSAVIRIGQTIEYDSISAVGEYEQGNKNPYYKTKNKDIVSISTPKGSRACKFAGIKAGTAKITGDYQSNSWKIKVTGSSVRPVPTATPTPTPKPVVKVTNAVNKKYKNTECEGTHQYKVPKITITGKNMKSINNKILKDIKKFGTDYEVGYSYYVDQKIVSIFVHINESHDSSPIGYSKVYNISVATGKLLNDSDVVKMWGSTDKKFFSIVKTVYKKVGNQFGILSYLLDNNPISYKYIDPYIGKNGHLCFTCFMQGIPNEDHAVKVDTKTKKIRDTFEKDF